MGVQAPAEPQKPQQFQPTIDMYAHSQKLDGRINDMEAKIKDLDAQIATGMEKARNSRGAQAKFEKQKLLNLLRKRKQYEQQVSQYYGSQGMIDNMAFQQENIKNMQDMNIAMKECNQVMQQNMGQIDYDEMAEMQDNMLDMKFQMDEMNEQMNQMYDVDIDEDDLDEELAQIENDLQLQGMMGQKC